VKPVAIGGFTDEIIGMPRGLFRVKKKRFFTAQITAEDNVPASPLKSNSGRARDVPRIKKGKTYSVTKLHFLMVVAVPHERQHGHGIFHGIERQGRTMTAKALLICFSRIFLLNLPAVAHNNIRQIKRGRGAEYRTPESLFDQVRKISAMIEMGMGQQYTIDVRRMERPLFPIELPQLLETLKKPGIYKYPETVDLEQGLRSGDRAGSSEKSNSKSLLFHIRY